jgi:hypothetical protein
MKNFLAGVLVTTSLALLGFQVVGEDPKGDSDKKVETKKSHSYSVQHIVNKLDVNKTGEFWEANAGVNASVLSVNLTVESAKRGDNARLAHIFPQGKYLTLVWEKQLIESENPKELDVGSDEEEVKNIK